MHRIHVVTRSIDDLHESWCSPDGAVVLMRDRGQREWKAVIDLVVVADADRVNGMVAIQADGEVDATMRAGDPATLAQRLARQERVHLVFDA